MLRSVFIAGVALWFGGVNCLAGCGAELLAAHLPAHEAAAESHDCNNDCCRREGESPRDASEPAPQPNDAPAHNDDCCPFLSVPPTLASKKVEVDPARADGVTLRGIDLATAAAVQSDSTLPEPSPPDGRDTHQRLSVLRI